MRLIFLALIGLAGGVTTTSAADVSVEFAQPQSAPRPAPFPIQYVDQGQFDPRMKGLLAPTGFRVDIVAEDPVVVNPTGLTFSPDGTLFVSEWAVDPVTGGKWFEVKETFRFRDGSTKSIATMKKFVVDPIKMLKWNAEKGVYDKSEIVIAEQLPSTLLWHDGWLYTASRGSVRRHCQSQVGGPWDRIEVIAQGFCGFHHHQVSGLTIGNDNKLYITTGDDDNFAEGSDGSRATVLRSGAIFRCNPDGSQMEVYSLGYRNPFRDIVCDDKFNFFHADNDNEDGSKFTGCRLMHIAEGVDYGWRLRPGTRCCYPDLRRAAIAGELPGKLPPMLKTGRGSPAGLLIYNDTKLPEQYRGLLYYPDVYRKLVRAYKVAPQGASFQVTHEFEFLKSNDPLFRPCQMVTGPDGAMYVCDWRTDSGGAGKLSGDGKNGRLYRVSWVGTPESPAIPLRSLGSWAKILKLPTIQLVEVLNAPDFTDRVEARKELIRRGKEGRDAVLQRFNAAKFTPDGRLVAMGVLQANWSPDVEELFRLLLKDESPDVRRISVEALALKGSATEVRNPAAIEVLLGDANPAVRRSAILALARVGADGTAGKLASAWMTDTSHDLFLEDAILRGIELLGPSGIAALLDINTPDAAAVSRQVKAFAGFRTEAALAALPKLIQKTRLTATERADLVRSFANYQFDPMPKSDALVEVFLTGKPDAEVAIAGLEVLPLFGTIDIKSATWVVGQLDSQNSDVRLAALKAIESGQVKSASPRLVQLLADDNRPVGERAAVLKALRTTAGASAVKPLTELLARNEPAALKIDALRSLGTASPTQARIAAESLLSNPDITLVSEAIAVLGASKEGAILVGQRYVAKRLPKELFAKVSEVVRKFGSDPEMGKLISDVLKGSLLLTMDPTRAEEIRKLVETKGNPKRGKELYLNTALLACATCHRMEGVGGNVGPDLTRLWDTQSTAKILESIVEPSKEIKEGFQSYKATTTDGRVIQGLKVIETPQEVTIRDAGGRDVRILKADLESLTVSKTSLMPDNAIAQLTFDQFIDLLAFLKDRTSQESLRGMVLKPAGK